MLAKRLLMLRQQNKKTQADMANLLGITRQAYGYYEKGIREPDNKSLSKLADYFKVSVDYLLGRSDSTNNQDEQTANKKELDNKTTEYVLQELVKKYNIDLTNPQNREILEKMIKLVYEDL